MIKKDNLKVFLACTAVAILFWLLNALGREYTSQINYPIQLNYELSEKKRNRPKILPEKITIQVTGKGWDLLKFKIKKSPPVEITINRYRKRNYYTNLELTKVFKQKLTKLQLNKVITKKIKVYE